MKKVLLTGGSGFIGGNIKPFLKNRYHVFSPSRQELDLRNSESVKSYIMQHNFDVVVHLASPSPVRSATLDSYDNLFKDCLNIFLNIYSVRDYCGKIIYSGSGAEYDKRFDIVNISESSIGDKIPTDDYGRAKYIMNELARNSNNIYNLRIFGCYGPNEYDSKFITHAIKCCLQNKDITIRQDCMFDYLYVDDYAKFVIYCIENDLKYHDYNVTSGRRVLLSEIAQIVKSNFELDNDIVINSKGFNNEYTASNARILSEIKKDIKIIELEDGIKRLIEWMKNNEKESC